jgi:hypothetical protein
VRFGDSQFFFPFQKNWSVEKDWEKNVAGSRHSFLEYEADVGCSIAWMIDESPPTQNDPLLRALPQFSDRKKFDPSLDG